MEQYHYVYRLDHLDTKEYYYGSRTCKVHPTIDPYLGSMRTWKPDKSRLQKTILDYSFKTRTECMVQERNLILESYKDPLNKNACIPGIGFETTNTILVKDNNTGKCFRAYREDPILKNENISPFWEGKTHSKESRERMSKSALTRNTTIDGEIQRRLGISINNQKPKTEEHRKNISKAKLGNNNPMYGKASSMTGKHYEKVKCKKCGKEVSITKIDLFHNDNCKSWLIQKE